MKILVISNLYGKEAKGGAEKFATVDVARLRAQGHDVTVLSASREKTKITREEVAFQTHNIFFYGDITSKSVIARAVFHVIDMMSVRSAWFVYRLLAKQNYEQVITHNLKGIGMMIPWGIWAARVPHVHVVHDVQLVEGSGLIWFGHEDAVQRVSATVYRAWMRFCFAPVQQVIFLSQYVARLHERYGFFAKAQKKVMIPEQTYHPRPITYHDSVHLLFVGQGEKHKGVDLLLEAMKKFPQHRATIVGEGNFLENIQHTAPANVTLVGKVSGEEVARIMKTADVLVVPSVVYENAPRVIGEAHREGMLVCASNIGGIPELLFADDILFTPTQEGLENALHEVISRLQDVRLCLHDKRPRG